MMKIILLLITGISGNKYGSDIYVDCTNRFYPGLIQGKLKMPSFDFLAVNCVWQKNDQSKWFQTSADQGHYEKFQFETRIYKYGEFKLGLVFSWKHSND